MRYIKTYKTFAKSVIAEEWAKQRGLDPYITQEVMEDLRTNPITCGFDDIEDEVRKRMKVENRNFLIEKLLFG